MSSAANSDRNLLFGMFALQNDHITQAQLIEAFQIWILRKSSSLDEIIRDKCWMSSESIDSVNALLDQRVARAGGQRQTLAAMPDDGCVLHSLGQSIHDEDLLRTIATVEAYFTRSIRFETQAETESESVAKKRTWDDRTDLTIDAVSPNSEQEQTTERFADLPKQNDSAGVDCESGTIRTGKQLGLDRTVTGLDSEKFTKGRSHSDPGRSTHSETRVRFETEFVFKEPVHLIGTGSFGDVFRSEDLVFQRQVALKRLQERHLTEGLTPVSFLLEAEINGKLDHPGVLPMYGLGKTAAGVPFYVMKMIDAPNFGRVIDEFHSAENSPGRDPGKSNQQFRKLLDHLRSVCMTMQYAHDRGVLHCDLKPANIMTGSYGETYVLDWGMALLVNPVEDWDKTRDHAPVNHPLGEIHPSRRVALHNSQGGKRDFIGGTLGYMAPEHRRAHDVPTADGLKSMTPACDVFALGVTLYQILTGKLPYAAVDGEDKVRQAQRVRSADYLPPRSIRSQVPKPLDAICMKAMASEPGNRYRSAAALADDLEKWLADEPVTAYLENRAESLRRWVRKNRAKAASVVATLVFATLASLAGLFVQTRHASELNRKNAEITAEQNRAQANERRALTSEAAERNQRAVAEAREKMAIEAVNQYSETVSRNRQLKNRPELEELRKELMKSPIEFFRKLRDDMQSSNDTRPESLESLAQGLYQLGSLNLEIGDQVDARISFAESAKILDRLVALHPDEIEYQKRLGNSLNSLGNLERATGQIPLARESMTRAMRTYEKLTESDPNDRTSLGGLARSLMNLGGLEFTSGNNDEAARHYDKSIEIYENLVTQNESDIKLKAGLSYVLTNQGQLMAIMEKRDLARSIYLRALELMEPISKSDPTDSKYLIDKVEILSSLGSLEFQSGNIDAARSAMSRSIEALKTHVQANPTVTEFRSRLARTQMNLGVLEATAGNVNFARNAWSESIETYESLVRQNPDVISFRAGLAMLLNNLGSLERYSENLIDSRSAHLKAIDHYEKLIEANPSYPNFRNGLADGQYGIAWTIVVDPGRDSAGYAQAVHLLRKAMEPYPNDIDILSTLGVAQYRAGQYREALDTLRKSLDSKTRIVPNGISAIDITFIAMSQFRLGNVKDAQMTFAPLLDRSIDEVTMSKQTLLQFVREASNLLYPRTLPIDPFQP